MRNIKLRKMRAEHQSDDSVLYYLEDETGPFLINEYIGKTLRLEFTGQINCVHCDRKTKKSFSQGYCYPCFQSLAQCDMCVVKPETCHYSQGTCREPQWGEDHCFIPHTVYLANSSGLKVGITRGLSPVSRWMDQGAIAGIPIAITKNRLAAGQVEVALKKFVSDKTNWRAMLKGVVPELDLEAERLRLVEHIPADLEHEPSQEPSVQIRYPVEVYPEKIKSFNFDKDPLVEGTLKGVKGQYLIFDHGVINLRKFSGYHIKWI